jgi:hypothetical protein
VRDGVDPVDVPISCIGSKDRVRSWPVGLTKWRCHPAACDDPRKENDDARYDPPSQAE